MDSCLIYTAGDTAALRYAVEQLKGYGCRFSDLPGAAVTHLLLPVPSLGPDGSIRGGGDLNELLQRLPENIRIIGGNLPDTGATAYDLLKDPDYIAENAYITAHCAVRLVMDHLPTALRGCMVLVIGWGRIGKCLAQMLHRLGCPVTVAARKESDLALLSALGYTGIPIGTIGKTINSFSLIFNTVPASVLLQTVPDGCIALELASKPGMPEENVIRAGGLPGLWASESSGRLIAKTILRHMKEDT